MQGLARAFILPDRGRRGRARLAGRLLPVVGPSASTDFWKLVTRPTDSCQHRGHGTPSGTSDLSAATRPPCASRSPWLPCVQPTCYDLGMCLGIPGKVIGIDGMEATVDFFGVRRQVRLDVVDEPVALGDYVLNHVGFAIRRIPESEVAETLKLFEELAAAEKEQDLLAADLRAELAATQERKK